MFFGLKNMFFVLFLTTISFSTSISITKNYKNLSTIKNQIQQLYEKNIELSKQISQNYNLANKLTKELSSLLLPINDTENSEHNPNAFSNVTIQIFQAPTTPKTQPIQKHNKFPTQKNRSINHKAIQKNNNLTLSKEIPIRKNNTLPLTKINKTKSLPDVNVINESDQVFKKLKVIKTPKMLQAQKLLEYPINVRNNLNITQEFKQKMNITSSKIDKLIKQRDKLLNNHMNIISQNYAPNFPDNIQKTYQNVDNLLNEFLKEKKSITSLDKN